MKRKFLLLTSSVIVLLSCATANLKNAYTNDLDSNKTNNNINSKVLIKFDANGGVLSGISAFKVESGSKFSSFSDKAPSISKQGCVSDPGWYILDGQTKKVVDGDTIFSSDTTLFANWSLYNVKFDTGEGKWVGGEAHATKTISNTSYVHIDDVEKPTIVGGAFRGWHDGTNYVAFPYTPTADVTLTAKYDINKINVVLSANGGYFSSTTDKVKTFNVNYGTKWGDIKKLESFPKTVNNDGDFLFDTWKIDGTALTDDNYSFTSSTLINATFNEAFSITFDVATNNGKWSGTSSSESKKVKIKKTDNHTFGDFKTVGSIPSSTGSQSGQGSYEELGWFTDSTADTDAIKDTDVIDNSKTVYAYYKEPHSITFNGSNFTVEQEVTSFIKKDKIEYTIKPSFAYSISKAEVKVKWNGEEKAEGESKDYTYTVDSSTGNGTLLINSAPGYDITVDLTPLEIKHKVTLVYNDDASTTKELDLIKHGEKLTEPTIPETITKANYTFVRWYSDENMNIKFDFNTSILTDVTLYAQWKPSTILDASYLNTEEVEIDGVTYNCITSDKYISSAPEKFSLPEKDSNGKTITAIGTHETRWDMYYINNATEIYLPSTYKLIGYNAFENFNNLEKVNIDNIEAFCEYSFYGKDFIKDINLPNCKKFIPSYEGSTYINTFGACSNIKKIINIGSSSLPSLFDECENITSVNISKSVTGSIDTSQFSYCNDLQNLTVDKENTSYTSRDNGEECNVIATNDTNKKILLGCTNSKFPTGCTEICDSAFSNSKKTSITIPDTVKKIGQGAFSENKLLEEVNFENDSQCTEIGNSAFAYCKNLKSIKIPTNCTSLGDGAFSDCSSLTDVTWNENVKTINNSLFRNCTSLESFAIPDNITSIGNEAFNGCSKLSSLTIGSSVQTIAGFAFAGTAITSISIPASVTSIAPTVFNNSLSLESVNVDSNNAKYTSKYNDSDVYGIIEKSSNKYIAGTKKSIIPEGITSLSERGFQYFPIPSSLPSTLTTLEQYAFACCTSSDVTLNYVKNIGNNTFAYCKSLTSVTAKKIETIGNNAFDSCSKLTTVYFSKTLTSLGNYIFKSTSGSITINFEGTETEWNAVTKSKYWNSGVTITMNYNQPIPE